MSVLATQNKKQHKPSNSTKSKRNYDKYNNSLKLKRALAISRKHSLPRGQAWQCHFYNSQVKLISSNTSNNTRNQKGIYQLSGCLDQALILQCQSFPHKDVGSFKEVEQAEPLSFLIVGVSNLYFKRCSSIELYEMFQTFMGDQVVL